MEVFTILKLYGPAVIFLVLFGSAFIMQVSERKTTLPVSILGIIQLQIPFNSKWSSKLAIILVAVLALSSYLLYDYTKFFPARFRMDVFFDQAGLRNSLQDFTEGELRELGIPDDYAKYQYIYFADLDRELQDLLSVDSFFTLSKGILHSEGETSFIIEKISGIQNYHILESEGSLTHVLEQPHARHISFKSFFQKVSSGSDYLRPSLVDIYIRRQLILKPMFKQIIAEDIRSDGIVFHHVLYGVTKVEFFPLPSFGKTLYLFEHESAGLIPIGYAEYLNER